MFSEFHGIRFVSNLCFFLDRFALGNTPFTIYILISKKYSVGSVSNFVSLPQLDDSSFCM